MTFWKQVYRVLDTQKCHGIISTDPSKIKNLSAVCFSALLTQTVRTRGRACENAECKNVH